MVFCGDLYQAQPIHDSLIFEQPTMNMQTITYDFWKDNISVMNCILQCAKQMKSLLQF
jgi:hypothetical protein